MARYRAVLLAACMATLSWPVTAQAATSSYGGCYELAMVRARPVVALQHYMPPGFEVAPFVDPTGNVSAYVSAAFRCETAGGPVVEMLDLVPVVPPSHLAGPAQNFLLLSGATSSAASRNMYGAWCIDMHLDPDAAWDLTTAGGARALSVSMEGPNGRTTMMSAIASGTESRNAAGTLRVLQVHDASVGYFDIAFGEGLVGAPVVATRTAPAEAEPGIAVHVTAGDGAPHDWTLAGSCA